MKALSTPRIFAALAFAFGLVALLSAGSFRLPGNNQGYRPVQPIEYSHRLHAGELKIDCQYCHFGGRQSRNAGIPPASVCMNCHRAVTAAFDTVLEEKQLAEAEGREPRKIISPKLQVLYDHLALDENLEPIPGREPQPIEWVRVHNLPDFVYFDHRPHVNRGLACQTCHGPVQSMERVAQDSTLSMGWCLDCHRTTALNPATVPPAKQTNELPHELQVSTDCSTCHF